MTKKKRNALIIILIVLLVVVAVSCVGLMVVRKYVDRIDKVDRKAEIHYNPMDVTADDGVADEKAEGAKDVDDGYTINKADKIELHGVTNILLIGQDRRPGEGTERTRSDSMILCSINPDTKQVSLISFMRDMYVYYPEYEYKDKMCHTYVYGGMQGLDDTIAYNFGIDIDYNIEVDFEGFSAIVDAIGGVDIELDGDEASVVGVGYESDTYHLDGEEALSYARIRKLDSDFNRTGRQRNVLNAIFRKAKDSDIGTLMQIVNTITENDLIVTDMSNNDLLNFAAELLPMLKNMEINSYRIPTDDAWEFGWVDDMSVLLVDFDTCREHLKNEFLPLG